MGWPTMSPMAKMCGTLVRICLSTGMKPRSSTVKSAFPGASGSQPAYPRPPGPVGPPGGSALGLTRPPANQVTHGSQLKVSSSARVQPGGQPDDRDVELGTQAGEVLQPGGEPAYRHLVLTTPLAELLDAPVSEVHRHLSKFCTNNIV